MGFNDVKVPLTFNQLQQNRSPPIGLRTFSIYVDELNGDPFGYPVGSRFSQTTITDFSSSNTQSAQLTSNQNSGSSLSVSDSTKAKITGNLLAGYAYCFFPSLITAMQGTCMGSCNRSCWVIRCVMCLRIIIMIKNWITSHNGCVFYRNEEKQKVLLRNIWDSIATAIIQCTFIYIWVRLSKEARIQPIHYYHTTSSI